MPTVRLAASARVRLPADQPDAFLEDLSKSVAGSVANLARSGR